MNEKKSFLERMGIIVSDDTVNDIREPAIPNIPRGVDVAQPTSVEAGKTVDLSEKVKHVNVVEEAYASLPQSNENIFVVEELLKNFEALPEQQRFLTLQSTLKTMGKDINSFVIEAKTRKNAIANELSRHSVEVENESKQIKFEIEEAKKKIDALTQRDLDLKNGYDLSLKECQNEVKRLDAIIKVLGGEIGGN